MLFLAKTSKTAKTLGVINAICLSLVLLYVAIHIPTFSMATYTRHFAYFGTAELIDMSESDLLAVTERLVGYMAGRYPDLAIYATVGGAYRPFFTQREIDHMVDVLLLFNIARILVAVSAVTLALTWFYAYRQEAVRWFCKANVLTALVVIVIGLGLALLFSQDFVHHFHRFHDIFFFFDYEQLWLLDPNYDMLINMVPYIFFINIFVRIGIIFGSLTLVSLALFGVLLWRGRSRY